MARLLHTATSAVVLAATWGALGAAESYSNSSSVTTGTTQPGVEHESFGVGCGSDTEYPTNTDESTAQPRFAYLVTNPLAEFISVHFKDFNLPENHYVQLRAADPASGETDVLKYRGNETSGDFYSASLTTPAVIVELFTEALNPGASVQAVNQSTCLGFTVDNYQYLAQGSTVNGSKEEVCGADNSREARCYQDSFSAAFQASNAVIRLLIKKETGSFFCTGWLLGSEGHVITNHHCINKQSHASNTEFEFMAEGSGCGVNCASPRGCRGKVRATYSTLIHADEALDYALVKLPVNLSSQYGYLRLRSSGARKSERIYVPQHPAGWGKRIAMKTDSGWGTVTSLTTGGCASNQVAYYLDTQGGSSGSPLLSSAGISAGVESEKFGVGCGSDMKYPTTTDNSTAQPRFAYLITNPLADFVSIHFKDFNLPENDYVRLRPADPESTENATVTYRGNEMSGSFYSTALWTSSVVVELFTRAVDMSVNVQPVNASACLGFSVDSYQYMAQGSILNGLKEEVCGADNSREASCYKSFTEAFEASKSVIRLLIKKSSGSYFCTGWLIGSEGHLITNHHCISTQVDASNTEFEFMAQGASCSISCDSIRGCRGVVSATSATLIYADETLDYALVKLPENLSSKYGYMRLRKSGAQLSERVYVPQHPAGWGKRIAMKTDSGWGTVTSLSMGGCATDQVAYYLDTQGGSSGSPVVSWTDNTVVALHHCGGCPNTAIDSYKLVSDMKWRGILPSNAVA
ncbi:hypothetical protein JM16_000231 [Phytophthora kernoviae]|uniref:Serine protease n=1 Tax=Phytophthora kernoviae TaxID=325452 RepID=A0A8T0MA28_9STRA|nr:hypothetical protein JM16_000231 [Phytophthora kernoviae]